MGDADAADPRLQNAKICAPPQGITDAPPLPRRFGDLDVLRL
jgi:hypothetical protein